MPGTRKATKRKTTRSSSSTTGQKFVVTGKFTLKSAPVSKTKANELVKKIRANGGTATTRKV